MSWSGGDDVFDAVAAKMAELNLVPVLRYQLCSTLIGALQQCGWATEDESLRRFHDNPAIVQAFADHGIVLDEDQPQAAGLDEEPPQPHTDNLLLERLRQHFTDRRQATIDLYNTWQEACQTTGTDVLGRIGARNAWMNAIEASKQAKIAYEHAVAAVNAGEDPERDLWVADVLKKLGPSEIEPCHTQGDPPKES